MQLPSELFTRITKHSQAIFLEPDVYIDSLAASFKLFLKCRNYALIFYIVETVNDVASVAEMCSNTL